MRRGPLGAPTSGRLRPPEAGGVASRQTPGWFRSRHCPHPRRSHAFTCPAAPLICWGVRTEPGAIPTIGVHFAARDAGAAGRCADRRSAFPSLRATAPTKSRRSPCLRVFRFGWPEHASISGSGGRSMRLFPVRMTGACVYFRYGWPGHASSSRMRLFPVRMAGACVYLRFGCWMSAVPLSSGRCGGTGSRWHGDLLRGGGGVLRVPPAAAPRGRDPRRRGRR